MSQDEDSDTLTEDAPLTDLIKITEDDRPAAIVLRFKDNALKIIADKKEEYGKLVITGVNDKEGYAAVKAAMGEMKSSRLVFSNAAEQQIITPMKAIVKEVNDGIEAIITGFKEVEADLRGKKNAIDEEKERLKEEERVASIKRVQERTVKLVALGAISDGMVYSFNYSQLLYVTATDVQDWPDERFAIFVADVEAEHVKELERKKQEEADKIEEDNNRLLREAALEKQVEQQSEETKALRLRIGNLRKKEMRMLGGVESEPDIFTFGDKPFEIGPLETLIDMPDEEWEALMASIENYAPPAAEPEPAPRFASETYAPGAMPETERQNPMTFDEAIIQTAIDQEVEADPYDGMVEVTMRFFKSEPYTDIAITPRRTMRFFPDEFKGEATAGIDALAEWKAQSLNCIVFDTIQ